MTVAELIAELQKYPADASVMRQVFVNGRILYATVGTPCTCIAEFRMTEGKGTFAEELPFGSPFPHHGWVVLRS